MNNQIKKKSIKEKIIDFLKSPKEVISFALPIIIALCMLIPMPYYVTIGGGVLSLNDKIEIAGQINKKGSFNSAYVQTIRSNVMFYLLSFVVPNYEREKIEEVVLEDEKIEDYKFREKLYFKASIENATKLAYEKAGKKVDIKSTHLHITYILTEAKTDLKVADEIIMVENIKVSNAEDMQKVINDFSYKEEIIITVIRNKKEINCHAKLIDINGEKKIGISLMISYDLDTNPKVNYNFSNNEQGPSGGLMLALNIYNKLIKTDITKGNKVVGTGTIDFDGTVGEIGGIKYKVMGAAKARADIMLVPKENYEEAIKTKEENGYNLKIVAVSTFEEALLELSKLDKK